MNRLRGMIDIAIIIIIILAVGSILPRGIPPDIRVPSWRSEEILIIIIIDLAVIRREVVTVRVTCLRPSRRDARVPLRRLLALLDPPVLRPPLPRVADPILRPEIVITAADRRRPRLHDEMMETTSGDASDDRAAGATMMKMRRRGGRGATRTNLTHRRLNSSPKVSRPTSRPRRRKRRRRRKRTKRRRKRLRNTSGWRRRKKVV